MQSGGLREPLPLTTQVLRLIPILFICVMILAVALVITNSRMPDPKVVRPLPDIGFEIFPKVTWLENVTDVCIAVLNLLSVLLGFKLYLLHRVDAGMAEPRAPFHVPFLTRFLFGVWSTELVGGIPHRDVHLIACIRFLASYSIVLIFRSLVIVMTSYPATDNHCQNPVPITNPPLNIFLTVVTFGSGSIHCGDLMFSGHTVIITLNLILQWTYGPMVSRAFRPISVLLVLLGFYSIIASRSHYTDDILVAFYATIVTFLAIPHTPKGVPWQFNVLIGWWHCSGTSSLPEDMNAEAVVIITEEHTAEESHTGGNGKAGVMDDRVVVPIMATSGVEFTNSTKTNVNENGFWRE